jgi:hypothetical protein
MESEALQIIDQIIAGRDGVEEGLDAGGAFFAQLEIAVRHVRPSIPASMLTGSAGCESFAVDEAVFDSLFEDRFVDGPAEMTALGFFIRERSFGIAGLAIRGPVVAEVLVALGVTGLKRAPFFVPNRSRANVLCIQAESDGNL